MASTKKDLVVDVYKRIRQTERACLVNTLREKLIKNRDALNKKINGEKKPLLEEQKRLSDLQRDIQDKLYKIDDKYREDFNSIANEENKLYGKKCDVSTPEQIRKFDEESDKKLLDYLNGKTKTLE